VAAAPVEESGIRFTADQTQIGFAMQWPPNATFSTDAYTEVDYLKGTTNGPTDEIVGDAPRLRLAYGRVRWNGGNDELVFGQTYTLFADLYPGQTFDGPSLALGAIAGREPQVQYTHATALDAGRRLTYAVSVNAPSLGVFSESTGVAQAASVPFLHAKIGYQGDRGMQQHPGTPTQISVSGFFGRERILTLPGATRDVNAWGAAIGGVLPIASWRNGDGADSAVLEGQVWVGQQVDGYFGGNGQGVYETTSGHVRGIRARGGFVEGKYFFSQRLNFDALYSIDRNDLDKLVQHGTAFVIDSGLFSGTNPGAPGLNKGQNANTALAYNPFGLCYVGLVWSYRKVNFNSGAVGVNNRLTLWVSSSF